MKTKFYIFGISLATIVLSTVFFPTETKAENKIYDVCLCSVYNPPSGWAAQTGAGGTVFGEYYFEMDFPADKGVSEFIDDFSMNNEINEFPKATKDNCANLFSESPFNQANLEVKVDEEKKYYNCSYLKCEWDVGLLWDSWEDCVLQDTIKWTKTYDKTFVLKIGKEYDDWVISIDKPVANVKMTCEGCDGLGELTDEPITIFGVPLVFSGQSVLSFSKNPKPGDYSIKITASQTLNGDEKYSISKQMNFKVEIDCGELVAGKSCTTQSEIESCKTACGAMPDYCVWTGDSCQNKSIMTGQDIGKAAAGLTTEWLISQYPSPRKEGWEGALPDCAFSGTCRKLNDLTQLLINFGKGMFAIMGSFAFAFFVYGGFTMIVSMGNAEKQKKGQQILVAAVIGIVIAFSAYMLINFMLEALDVAPDFRGIK